MATKLINYNSNIISEEKAPQLLPNSVFRSKDGLFESMLMLDNQIQLLPFHFARLDKGMLQLGFVFPFLFDLSFFEKEILKTVQANHIAPNGRIRFQVFKEHHQDCNFIVEVVDVEPSVYAYNQEGWKLGLVNNNWKHLDDTTALKAINPNLYTSTNDLVKQNNWDDLLLVNDGFISESGTANLFIVRDDVIYTPPLSQGCIAGVMRTYVIDAIQKMELRFFEKPISTEMLLQADEVFLTNAVRRIKWVGKIENKKYLYKYSLWLSGNFF